MPKAAPAVLYPDLRDPRTPWVDMIPAVPIDTGDFAQITGLIVLPADVSVRLWRPDQTDGSAHQWTGWRGDHEDVFHDFYIANLRGIMKLLLFPQSHDDGVFIVRSVTLRPDLIRVELRASDEGLLARFDRTSTHVDDLQRLLEYINRVVSTAGTHGLMLTQVAPTTALDRHLAESS